MKMQHRHAGHVLIAVLCTFAVVFLALASFSPLPAFAIDPKPIPEPIDPPDIIDPLFKAPANGFDWKMAPRFGSDQNGDHVIDYHWDEASATYDPAHVRPSQFAVLFRGCPDKDENRLSPNGVNSYKWELLTKSGSTILLGNSHSCRPLFSLPPHGVVEPTPWDASYRIKLTITAPDNQSQAFENIVHVRDFLIVSIGDSYGSGEGTPDVPQVLGLYDGALNIQYVSEPAKWADRRCHRSAFAGPAQAALAIEGADPQTSVTFLSFACSGAAVHKDSYAPYDNADAADPYAPGDPNKHTGSGLLGSYLSTNRQFF